MHTWLPDQSADELQTFASAHTHREIISDIWLKPNCTKSRGFLHNRPVIHPTQPMLCGSVPDTLRQMLLCYQRKTNQWKTIVPSLKKLGWVFRERVPAYVCISTCKVRVMTEHLPLRVLDLLEKVLRSSSHPHLLDDLLVENCSLILQLTAACLSKWITSLSEKEKEKEINNSSHGFCGKGSSLTANLKWIYYLLWTFF